MRLHSNDCLKCKFCIDYFIRIIPTVEDGSSYANEKKNNNVYSINMSLSRIKPHYITAGSDAFVTQNAKHFAAAIFRRLRFERRYRCRCKCHRAAAWKCCTTWRVPFSSVALKVRCTRGTRSYGANRAPLYVPRSNIERTIRDACYVR
jgi:hypothetical protein